jgi:hypothetical protein
MTLSNKLKKISLNYSRKMQNWRRKTKLLDKDFKIMKDPTEKAEHLNERNMACSI